MSSEPKFESFDVRYLADGHVAVVALNKPKKFNCISFEEFAQLRQIFEFLGNSESAVRAIVFTGIGKNFSAGLDLVSAMAIA